MKWFATVIVISSGAESRKTKKVRGLVSFLRLWREQENSNIRKNPKKGVSMHAEFLYSLEDLNRQDEERKKPRRDPNAMADPYSLSNTLRAVGEFLDRKPDVKLLFTSNRGQDVVILYETKGGVRNLEEYPISMLYDLSIKKYVSRKK